MDGLGRKFKRDSRTARHKKTIKIKRQDGWNGWTAGLGLEYMITPNWIIGAEYDYINLGTASYEVGGGLGSYTLDVRNHIHQVLGRVSFKFGP